MVTVAAALIGSREPRVFTPPLVELTPETSLGFDIIWFAKEILREPLTPWQQWFVIHAFELMTLVAKQALYPDRPDLWDEQVPRFKTVLLMVARQNGKTHVVKVVIKWALFRQRLKYILGAAQTKNDAKELWEEIVLECEEHPGLNKRMKRTTFNNGSEALRSKWGAYRIAGLDRKAGRGKTVNLLFMDELREHKTWEGWAALSSTTLSPVFGLNLTASNAGDWRSVVLNSLRDGALANIDAGGTEATVGLFEWSADPDLAVDDRRGWAQANPDLGHGRMTVRDIQAEFEAKSEPEFRTENLCQRVDDLEEVEPAITPERWAELRWAEPASTGQACLAINVSPGSDLWTVAAAVKTTRGVHVEIGRHAEATICATVDFIKAAVESGDPVAIVIPRNSPAAVLERALIDAGVEPEMMTFPQMKMSTAEILKRVSDGTVTHGGDQRLDEAVSVAVTKAFDSGASVAWSETMSEGDISPLVAATYAAWGLGEYTAEVEIPPAAIGFQAQQTTTSSAPRDFAVPRGSALGMSW
ncbi:terminase large subunit [Corynebacterium phage Bran]|nr:terminase large subunit [Corynebacterium phage Bran]